MAESEPDPDPADAIATRHDAPIGRRRRGAEARAIGAGTGAAPTREIGQPLGAASASRVDDVAFQTALRVAEIARARTFVPILLAMLAGAVAFALLAGGDPTAKRMLYVGVAISAIAITYLLALTRRPEAFTEGRLVVIYAICMLGFHTGVYFWGVFSPVAAIGALGIFFLGLGRTPSAALLLYLLCVVPQALLAAVIIAGVLRDRGLVTADRPDVGDQILQQAMLQVVYLVTYLMARSTRMQLDHAVRDHGRATRAVAQRDALLVEARQELDQALRIGGPGRYTDQIVGSYRLGVVIGRGAMGDVYDAVHVETGAPAALKLLGAAAAAMPGPLTRFYREAHAVARLDSSHIVKLLGVSPADAAIPYLAMERLRGADLAQLLREQRKLPLTEVVELAMHVARGLDAARAQGIVHRDIKPQNLYRDGTGRQPTWKLLDFGVSKLADHHGTLTTGHIIGTPMYMAPEQARGQDVDHRADIFALTAVIYRALTGQPAHAGRDMPAILFAVVHRIPQRPSEHVKVPTDIDRVLALGLAKRPVDRFATAGELADALAAAADAGLTPELRDRADAYIARHPWGADT